MGMAEQWIAKRMQTIEMSGIRKIFELGRSLQDPIDLSIGQPHFPVPEPIKSAAHAAIDANRNGYTVTQGIPELRAKIAAWLQQRFPGCDRETLITSGTSGGLVLSLLAVVDPGDEVILFEPHFVSYPHLVRLAGGMPVVLGTYPDFQIDVSQVAAAITPRTKAILLSTPSNPTGAVASRQTLRDLTTLAREKNVLLISDEIYRVFCYDGPLCSPAEFDDQVLVLDGFGKSYGITGWRLGFAHGPRPLLQEMMKLQQFTFVCAPSIVQYAGLTAWDYDVSGIVAEYREKRDRLVAGLRDRFRFTVPGGAFYLFVEAPWGTATEFVTEAIRHNLLLVPGAVFGRRDTHFRISYAAKTETLDRGIEVLNRLASRS